MNHQEHQEEKGGDGVGWEPVDEIDDDLARRIISAAIEVHKTLGPGFSNRSVAGRWSTR